MKYTIKHIGVYIGLLILFSIYTSRVYPPKSITRAAVEVKSQPHKPISKIRFSASSEAWGTPITFSKKSGYTYALKKPVPTEYQRG